MTYDPFKSLIMSTTFIYKLIIALMYYRLMCLKVVLMAKPANCMSHITDVYNITKKLVINLLKILDIRVGPTLII
jgi:hypothetical protein